MEQLLSGEEQERAARMRAPGAGRRFVISHGATRAILARYLGYPPAQFRFQIQAGGKPQLLWPAGAPALSFSLSHSKDLALCAVALERDLGVDVEQIRPLADWPQIAARYFSPDENEVLHALSGEAARAAFFQGWTGKEAYTKALGRGISSQWAQFSVPLATDTEARLPAARPEGGAQDVFTVCALAPGTGYAAAIAAWGTDWGLSCWDWSWPNGPG
jgi:4'-phosphopantetheinyl transferase